MGQRDPELDSGVTGLIITAMGENQLEPHWHKPLSGNTRQDNGGVSDAGTEGGMLRRAVVGAQLEFSLYWKQLFEGGS